MNPTDIALWSLAVLLVVKIIVYIVYKKLSKASTKIKDDSNDKKPSEKET